ncbi:LacI family DNA-binding transcriptional regulator [Candidatus Pristimantibacillus sp. PTI5]|uniref:LacI family DNA-binding transcriptional regulator n=1 Tax=Candidatus Pristimantibacillus sp. PTI5 TaxID=3400422 RepID=UPI003B0274CB
MIPSKITSIKDVARRANVSSSTVSHVINDTRFVSEITKAKVRQAMNELNYRMNAVARSLRSRKSRVIAFVAPILASETSNYFFMKVAEGIKSVLKQNNYHLVLSDSHEDPDVEAAKIRVLGSQMIDGLIMAPTNRKFDYESLFGEYPVVYLDRTPDNSKRDCVVIENKKISNEAVKTLLDKGYKRIALLTGPVQYLTTTEERYEGYIEAILDAGLAVDTNLIGIGEVSFDGGYRLMDSLIKHNPTAVFITDNSMAMGAMLYLQEHNISIPQRLAVIAYDEFIWIRITSPSLNVINQPAFEIGAKAAEVILMRQDNSTASSQKHRLDAVLTVRQSLD